MNTLLPLNFGKFIQEKLKCKFHCSWRHHWAKASPVYLFCHLNAARENAKWAPVSIRAIIVERGASCSGILHLHLSCTDSSLHPVALFQLPKGLQHDTNHLFFSSLINSMVKVLNRTYQVIKSSCHTLSFRKGSGTKLLRVYKLSFQIHLQCLFPFQTVGGLWQIHISVSQSAEHTTGNWEVLVGSKWILGN